MDKKWSKRKTVEFGDLLSEKMSGSIGKVTNEKHFAIESSSGSGRSFNITKDLSTDSLRTDENNVNIDTEMSELSKNIIYYNMLSNRATAEITKLKDAITSR